MINIGTLLFVLIIGLSIGLGMFITWQIRGKRIAALESILRAVEQEKLELEMEKGNLEEFINHWKTIGANRKKSKTTPNSKVTTNNTKLRRNEW